jgi:hypothetical protein
MEENPLISDPLEEALRHRLTSLADVAPVTISNLDRKLARRLARARRRRRTGFGAAAIAILVCGAGASGAWALSAWNSPTQAVRGEPISLPPDPLACPQVLSTFTLKTAHPGLGKTMVPGAPVEARICGYDGSTWHLVVGEVPVAFELPPLIAQLNAAGVSTRATCAVTQAGRASKILIRFGYQAGAEADVLVTLSGTKCPSETNGVLRGSLPAALTIPYFADQGDIAPPSTPWNTSENTLRPVSSPGQPDQSSPPQSSVPSSSSQAIPVPPSGSP